MVLSINPTANVFVFRDFESIIRKAWTILEEIIDLVVFYLKLSYSDGKLSYSTLTVLFFRIYLFFLTLVFVLKWLSCYLEFLIMFFSDFLLTLCQTQNRIPCFIAQLINIFELTGTVFAIILDIWFSIWGGVLLTK